LNSVERNAEEEESGRSMLFVEVVRGMGIYCYYFEKEVGKKKRLK